MPSPRMDVARIVKRHGAYLISLYLNSFTEDGVPDDHFDVASSIAKARAVAIEMADGFGITGPFRFRHEDGAAIMTAPEQEYEGPDMSEFYQ